MQGVSFELIFWKAGRFCGGTAIYHIILACIGALSLRAATGFGGCFVCTYSTAGTTVIGIAAVDVDTDVLFVFCAKRFLRFLARSHDALPADAIFEFGTRDEAAA